MYTINTTLCTAVVVLVLLAYTACSVQQTAARGAAGVTVVVVVDQYIYTRSDLIRAKECDLIVSVPFGC